MTATLAPEQTVQSIEVKTDELINAPIEIVWESILAELGPESAMPDGKPFPFTLEAWPGGRWFRDLGNNTGHLWGHVQVIKPPTLLEITGQLPMSYAATNHLPYKLKAEGNGTRMSFRHTGIGLLTPEHRDGMREGWGHFLTRIKARAEKSAKR
jgi:uncharacterized protein YndB with AHSA1/START domain